MAARRPLLMVGGQLRQMTAAEFADLRWQMTPIGVPFGVWSHLAGVDIPPNDNPNYRYIKLTASDSYNTGVLTSESIIGSAPHVQATAVISDAGSPLNGQTVQLVNTGRWLLRPGQSGLVELDAFQAFGLRLIGSPNSTPINGGYPVVASNNLFLSTNNVLSAFTNDGTNGTPRTGSATRDKSIGADYYMRIR